MTTHRFLVRQPGADEPGEIIKFDDPAHIRQMTRVLRLAPGDVIEVIDGGGAIIKCKLLSLARKRIEAVILERSQTAHAPSLRLTIFLSLLKGGRFDECLAKLVEIGVERIVPLICQRTVVRLSLQQASERLQRWQAIAAEATEQCERNDLLEIVNPIDFCQALNLFMKSDKAALKFICAERSQAPHLIAQLLEGDFDRAPEAIPPSDISIVIGPEGGFTQEEIAEATTFGCIPCTLGDNILRSDTAAIAAAFAAKSVGEFLWYRREYQSSTQNHM